LHVLLHLPDAKHTEELRAALTADYVYTAAGGSVAKVAGNAPCVLRLQNAGDQSQSAKRVLHSRNCPSQFLRPPRFLTAPICLRIGFAVACPKQKLTRIFPMRWVRTKGRCGSWLALAAMALQLVLSFAHVHVEKLASGSGVASIAASKAPSSQQSPAQHPANGADDYCAICATIHLTSSSFLPDAPLLPVPFASRTIEHCSYFDFIFIAPQRAAFQSRAPPLA
jgi:hypothetical protein